MDRITHVTQPLLKFSKDSVYFLNRCTKPDRKEFNKTAMATAIGFFAMGILGFVVKLVFIPINSIIVGA